MLVLYLLSALILSIFAYYFKSLTILLNQLRQLEKLPGPPREGLIVGNIRRLFGTPESIFDVFREWSRIYYPIYKVAVVHFTAACIFTPEDCELVMTNPKHSTKSQIYDVLHDWLGTGLLTSFGEKWKTRRKILTPAFHFGILQQFIEIFSEETEKLVENIMNDCHKPYIEINQHITQFALKTIAETAMGTKLEFIAKKEQEYKNAILELGDNIVYKLIRPWMTYKCIAIFTSKYYKEKKLLQNLHSFTRHVIALRETEFNNKIICSKTSLQSDPYFGKKRLAMLDLLLEAKRNDGIIDDEGIREEVDTFMFKGHDTTSGALSFAFLLLACNKEVQHQIIQEMLDILGDLRNKPKYNDLQKMKYLERCIKEVLRLYPSVPFISRELGEDLITHSGYLLPKGSLVHILIYDLHRSPHIYPDPEKFDPDRFLPNNLQNRHPFAYLPFSAGPRNCIGQKFAMLELKAAICGILSKFILEPIDTPCTITLIIDLILRTRNSIKVKFVPRSI